MPNLDPDIERFEEERRQWDLHHDGAYQPVITGALLAFRAVLWLILGIFTAGVAMALTHAY